MPFVYSTNLSEVRVLAETQARRAGLPEDRVVDFVIAVSEIAANTVRHARTQGSMEIWCEGGPRPLACPPGLRQGGTTLRLRRYDHPAAHVAAARTTGA
jgi:hypothetical protein